MLELHQEILVKEVMKKDFLTINTDASLEEMIDQIFLKGKEEIFVVNPNEELIGLFSLKGISEIRSQTDDLNQKIEKFLKERLLYLSEDTVLTDARDLMIEKNIEVLPIVREQKIIGVIRKKDIIDNLYISVEKIKEEISYIVDNIHEAVCVLNKDREVILWNKNAEKLYNIPKEKILGKDVEVFFPNALMLKVFKTKESIDNIQHSPKEGSNVVISAEPIFINGEFQGAVSTERDITEMEKLSEELKKATETVEFLEQEVQKLTTSSFDRIIGKSKKILHCIEKAKQVSKTKVSVMINGESGTGKEMFAKAIHEYSDRKGLFIPVNCSAIPEELFESEFFGYVEGAFTGAKKSGKIGYFELANNGTIFLDEIGDLPLNMQAKLLRVLQEEKIKRVGGEKQIGINLRVISATNKDLKQLINEGKFREDLYFRLNVIGINLPPLRKRREDIELFIRHFIEETCERNNCKNLEESNEVIQKLVNYDWPGNVRELKNAVEQMVVLSNRQKLTVDDIPEYIGKETKEQIVTSDNLDLTQIVENIEIQAIKKALEESEGNKSLAAKLLNIPRTTLYYKIKQYNLNV